MKTGDKAPDFTLYSDEKEPFSLSSELSESPVLLLFFPGAFTSVCTTELNQVNNDIGGFSRATIAGISTDSPFALAAFKEQNGFRFSLLSDHDGDVSAEYGVKYDRNFTSMQLDRISRRAAFVVDREGIVQYAEVMESAGDLPDLEAVKETLANLH